jgi:hypothetical protein
MIKNMKNFDLDRGFYFQISAQDFLKTDLWIEKAIVFAKNPLSAAHMYLETFCQEKDHIENFHVISQSECDFWIRGEYCYECKHKIKILKDWDTEIPAYLRAKF